MVTRSLALDEVEPPGTTPRQPSRDRNRLTIPALTAVLVAVLAQLPVLRPGWFYFNDDAANQILPMWYHMGEQVRAGVWPPVLDPDLLLGGNLAAETLFGVWNPVNAVVWVGVSLAGDIGVAGLVVRTLALVVLALGCYLLCREYAAARWASSAVATALPLAGSLLYFDVAKWPAALLAFIWVPWVWVGARRALRGRTNAFWVFVLGALGVTAGNPYGLLGICVVLCAMLLEGAVQREWAGVRRLLLVSTAIASVVPLVYLPLLRSSEVIWRSPSGVTDSGHLAPQLTDLLNLSMPIYLPEIAQAGVPTVYFCWFAVPLALWCDWGVLRRRWRELTGVFAVAAAYTLIALGPSEVWMFRWPLRVVHYDYLAIAVALAVLLTTGLRSNRWRARAAGTAVFLLLTAYFTIARTPDVVTIRRTMVIVALIGALTAAAVWAYRAGGTWRVLGIVQLGTVLTFAAQAHWFIAGSEPSFLFPTSAQAMRESYEDRFEGRALQIADTGLNVNVPPDASRPMWQDITVGNAHLLSGVDFLNSYTGIGYTALSDVLCSRYEGSNCPGALDALWRTPPGAQVPLADLLLLDTVVVQHKLIAQPVVPPGWHVAERTERMSVLQRVSPIGHSGHLSWSSPNLHVASDFSTSPRHEVVEVDGTENRSGRVIFAKTAWPGYTATWNGIAVPAKAGPGGLLEVTLPAGQPGPGRLELTWTPPGMRLGLAATAFGALLAAGAGVHQARHRS